MTAQAAGATLPCLPRLLATARTELDRHLRQGGTCRECGAAWPCEVAAPAAFTLEAVDGR